MTKKLYTFGIFLTGLSALLTLFQSYLYFQLGERLYTLQTFADWFIYNAVVYLIVSYILLKYFHDKKYSLAFSSGIIYTATSLCFFILFYNMLISRELERYYFPVYLAALGTGILHALSLIFSMARERAWLKTAGVFLLILNVITISLIIWAITSGDVHVYLRIVKLGQWISWAAVLIPLSFTLNFLGELNIVEQQDVVTDRQGLSDSVMSLVGLVALVSALYLGKRVGTEGYWVAAWLNKGLEEARELAKPFEARSYVNTKSDTLRYRLMIPLDYDSNRQYPLVVCLHGSSGSGTDNVKQIEVSQSARLLSQEDNRKKYPAFLFVPQCAEGYSWGGVPILRPVDSLVFEAIHALEMEFKVDTTRRYVMGESLGGYGSWYFIGTRPEMFAAAIPICGGGNPALAKNMVDVPVWAFHGSKDRNVPVRLSRQMIEPIKNAGGNPKYTEFPDEGHNIWENVKNTPGLLDWLFAQKRDTLK